MPSKSRNAIQDAFVLSKTRSTERIERVGDTTIELHMSSKQDPKRKALEKALTMWLNERTENTKVVRDFVRDLRNGDVIICLLRKYSAACCRRQEYH